MNARQLAKQNGDIHYFGRACRRGHVGMRYTVNADCVDCLQNRQSTTERQAYETAYRKTDAYQTYQRGYQKVYIATEKYKQQKSRYARNNKAKMAAKSRLYSLGKALRTPAWLTADDLWLMEQAYELAALRTKVLGFPWQVDHILPVHGRLVSGLHVPHNLQVIPAYINRSKSNRYDPA